MNQMHGLCLPAGVPGFTPKQGQYLAFIHAYTLVNERPPAQADIQRFFRLTSPSVYQMLLTLEREGLISRRAGVPRSIAVLVDRALLPALKPPSPQPVKFTVRRYSHVRRFKLQAQNFFARPSSCSAWPLLGKAGGRIMKRRLIML